MFLLWISEGEGKPGAYRIILVGSGYSAEWSDGRNPLVSEGSTASPAGCCAPHSTEGMERKPFKTVLSAASYRDALFVS